jgi:uncharacterized protein with HEPN domain
MNKPDGGPAFPIPSPEMAFQGQTIKETQGMTLRDYFAAKAMDVAGDSTLTVGEAAKEIGIEAKDYNGRTHWPLIVAKRAYQVADAMIAEREKK